MSTIDRGDNKLVEMLSLTEEINSINTKIKQLVEDLHNTTGVLINLQDMTDKLKGKVGSFSDSVGKYKPNPLEEEKPNVVPSNADGIEQEVTRIVPTPENEHLYNPKPVVRNRPPVKKPPIVEKPRGYKQKDSMKKHQKIAKEKKSSKSYNPFKKMTSTTNE